MLLHMAEFHSFYLFIYLFIYLFVFWLCWVFVSVWGLSLVAASGGHSSSRCAGLSPSRPLPLWSTGSRRAGSVVVAHGPNCSAACGILPDQGSSPCPLHWQADRISFFLWLSSIPLCVCVCVCVCVCIYLSIYHIFFPIHLLMNAAYFYILAVVNNAAVNVGVHVSFRISVFVFSGYCPGVELLGPMIVLFLVFWETAILFSTVDAPVYIPTNSVWGFPFLILTKIYFCPFWWWPFWQVWGHISLWLFFKIFLTWTIFKKSFIEFVTLLLLFMPWSLGREARGIPALWPGIKPTPPALEGKVPTTGLPGNPHCGFDLHFPDD